MVELGFFSVGVTGWQGGKVLGKLRERSILAMFLQMKKL